MVSYDKLVKILKENGLKKSDLTKVLGISSRTVAKIGKGEKIADNVLQRIAEYFSCAVEDLYCDVCDNSILQVLREEMENKISGGLYHETQVRLTYNSNRIEGSKLSEDQTRLIFETNTIGVEDGVPVDDIIETNNHFRAIDYVIAHAEEELTEAFIKELHCILKTATSDSRLSWFRVGDYKSKPNTVGGAPTVSPNQVCVEIQIYRCFAYVRLKLGQGVEINHSFHHRRLVGIMYGNRQRHRRVLVDVGNVRPTVLTQGNQAIPHADKRAGETAENAAHQFRAANHIHVLAAGK